MTTLPKNNTTIDAKRASTLDTVAVGCSCTIISCSLPSKLMERFAEMGLVANTKVTVIRVAPLGDPIVIRARGYELCLRKETAQQFSLTPIFNKG